MTKEYKLLVCPLCRGMLYFVDSTEGMYARAEHCGRWWLYPDQAQSPDNSALRITVSESE